VVLFGEGIVPPIRVEVIAPLISGVKHCQRCTPIMDDAGLLERVNRDELSSVPKEMWQEDARLSRLVRDLAQRYGSRLQITLIDPHTPMGLWKSIRHWVRRYPTFIVNGRSTYTGWDANALDSLLQTSEAAS
jgi:hypothetical protein